MSVRFEKRYFNVAEYYRMAAAGVLSQDDHVELIEGEVIKMSPIGSRHAACVRMLDAILNRQMGQSAIVSIQNPVRMDDYSEPEPDIAVLKARDGFYAESHPTPEDVLLIIEVADTSIEYDRTVKLPLYARAGIPETWILNLGKNAIEAYTEPLNAVYQKCRLVNPGETLHSTQVRGIAISVKEILQSLA